MSLLALIGIGGLLAYFGQTYQTGADPWQLFAWWALLALPLCAGARHDALWSAWVLVTATAISLWVNAHSAHSWSVSPSDLLVHLAAWTAALLLAFALCPAFSRKTGAGLISMRLALTLAISIVGLTAFGALFQETIAPQFWVGLFMLAGAALGFALGRFHDTFALSAVGLTINVLVVSLLAHTLVNFHDSAIIGLLVVVGLCAAGMLTGTVTIIMSLAQGRSANGGAV